MKICFPVSENKGLESRVFDHFGSAPMFLLVDAEERSIANVINREVDRRHGACRPTVRRSSRSNSLTKRWMFTRMLVCRI